MKNGRSTSYLIAMAVCYGFFTIISQILFIREYFVISGGNELFIGAFFFTWFFGVVVGSQISSHIADHLRRPLQTAITLVFFQTIICFLDIFLIRSLRGVFQIAPGEHIPLMKFWLGAAATLFPFSFLTGFNFPLLCRSLVNMNQDEAPSIGKIYVADSIGSVIGGIAFTFILVRFFKPIPACFFLSALVLGSGFFALRESENERGALKILSGTFCVIFLFASLTPAGDLLDKITQDIRWNTFAPGFLLIDSRDTPYQHLSLAQRDNQFSLLSNGGFITSFPDPYGTETDTHLIMTVSPEIRRILILGGGNLQILPVILSYPIEKVDYVEMDDEMLPFLAPYLCEEIKESLQDKRLRIIHEDARAFVRKAARDKSRGDPLRRGYDLVWVNISEPDTAEANRFYTVDFYEEVLEILEQRGVLVASCSSAVNYFGVEVSEYVQSIYKSLDAVFDDLKITPGTVMRLFASPSKGTLTLNADTLTRRYERRKITSDYFSPHLFSSLLEPFQIDFTEKAIRKNLDAAPLNSDLRPTTYLFNLRLWASRSGENIARAFDVILSLRIVHAAGFIVLLLLTGGVALVLKRKHPDSGVRYLSLYLIITTGICGMSAQLVLLYLYQSVYGCLYQRVGLFVAFFMMGLTIGGRLATLILKKADVNWKKLRKLLLYIDFAYWLILIGAGLAIPYGIPHEVAFYVMAVLVGSLTGAAFPLGARAYILSGVKVGRTSGKIDMADHAGAMFGSLATGIILLPALGIPAVLILLAMLKLTSFSLIYLFKGR